ncbi:hypothetical protein HanXRQr2_Chr08g0339871 [Helianthus annuus]|uniref:Uncharacterized protein n=1 Tax=Helianthus annuus TaxID=4232 RepID=A0A9K3ND73_HELAN|nr:hypothetical protein HanXRQr2_Chr08g0339871 [Helianthus annuus]
MMPDKENCFWKPLKRTPNCELTQLVVDSLLHALQDHRYSAGACMEVGRCGTQIAAYYVKLETI